MQGRHERDDIFALEQAYPVKADESAVPLMDEPTFRGLEGVILELQANPSGTDRTMTYMADLGLSSLPAVEASYALCYIRTVTAEKINRNAVERGWFSKDEFGRYLRMERFLFFQAEQILLASGVSRQQLMATRSVVEEAYMRKGRT